MSLRLDLSLSVKITSATPQDISDEILGGTLAFCKETGYRQNIMMFTFFWSAFLLSVKKELEEHGLIEDIMKCYITSLENLFPNVSKDDFLRKEIDEVLTQYWTSLTSDFSFLRTDSEVSTLLQIANELNNRSGNNSATFIRSDSHMKFSCFSNDIRVNVYNILRQNDNRFVVRYRDEIKNDFRSLPLTYANRYTQTQPKPTSTTDTQKKGNKASIIYKIIAIIVAVFIGLLIINAFKGESEPKLTPVKEPESGEILVGSEDYWGSKITVTASSGNSCVVKLKTSSGTTRLSFYVQAGDTVTIGVPKERLYVYFASGDTWYGQYHLFGEDTSYSMDDTICDFTRYTLEYTLYPVASGNFSQTPIDKKDF